MKFLFLVFILPVSKALEKNQQWLAYDQQREAYVTAVLARIYQLEQKQGGTSGVCAQHKEANSEGEVCSLFYVHAATAHMID